MSAAPTRPARATGNGVGRVVFAAGAILGLVVAVSAYAAIGEWRASIEARAWVDHTHEVIDDIRRLFDDVQDVETGGRGYLLTGDSAYLAPYDAGLERRNEDIRRLRHAAGDNPDQVRRLDRLDALIDKKINVVRHAVELRKTNDAVALTQAGRLLMTDIRSEVEEMIAAERNLLAQRNAERDRASKSNLRIAVAAFVVAVLSIAAALAFGAAYLSRRRTAEEAAAAQSALLAATLESMGPGIGVHDADLRLLLWNKRYQEYSGVEEELFVPGVPIATLLRRAAEVGDLGADSEAWIAGRLKALAARVPYEMERTRPDGTVLLIRGTFTADGLGVTTFSDITAIKTAQRDLTENVARLRAIFDNTLDGIVTINESGTVESFNPAAEQVFGYPAAEVLGRNIKILMPEPYRGHHDGYLRNYVQTGDRKIIGRRREVEGMRKDGAVFPMELSVNEFSTGGRRLFVGMVRDISERRQMERIKGEFVSMVSHELRTPLTSIAGALGLLAGGMAGELPQRARRLVEIANNNGERLVRLVNDILDLDKIESGRMKFSFAPSALRPLVEASLEANRAYAAKYQVRFALDPAAIDGTVLADADRIAQVLANLLSNAAKFSPAGEAVAVGIGRHGNQLRVSVRDKGPGVPDEFRPLIFQKFAQADAKDNRRKGGTGLGLSISRSVVERHGGTLSFESAPGQGAAFFMDLPQWEEGVEGFERRDVAHAAAGSESVGEPLHVLHVEDDADVCRIVGFAMEGLAEVTSVQSVAEARRALGAAAFDLVILDIALPDGSGLSLWPMPMARLGGPMPVIVFSSQDFDMDVDPKPEVKAVLTKSKASAMELRRLVLEVGRAAAPLREAGE